VLRRAAQCCGGGEGGIVDISLSQLRGASVCFVVQSTQSLKELPHKLSLSSALRLVQQQAPLAMGAGQAARQPSPSYIDKLVDHARSLGTQVEQKER
jgi:hypothetical protein